MEMEEEAGERGEGNGKGGREMGRGNIRNSRDQQNTK